MTAPNTPTWLAPAAPGQLSNNHGTNSTTDGIGFQAHMSSPKGAGSPLSLVRMQAFRTGVGGNPSTSQLAWDSGWTGGSPAVQQLPIGKAACGGNSSALYNGRLYVMASDGTLMSAPIASAAVGTWRYENPIPAGTSGTPSVVYSMDSVGSRLYCTASITTYLSSLATLYVAAINPDGTVGSWTTVPGGLVSFSDATWKNTLIVGGWDGKSATGWIVQLHSGVAPVTITVNIADGSVTTPGVSGAGVPTVARDNLSSAFIAAASDVFHLYLIGGTAAAASAVVDVATIDASLGTGIGTFAAKQALPAARTGGTLIVLQDGTVYYIGGSSGITAALATTTVYFNTAANIFNLVAWSTSAQVLPSPTWLAGGGITMPDYDLLGAKANLADSATEVLTGGTLASNADAMAIVSFRAATTAALVGVVGAFTTGSNTTVTPPFGQATVAAHLLVAWVTGSDHAAGTPGLTFGQTGAATSSWNWSGANTDNQLRTALAYSPAQSGTLTSLSVYMGGYSTSVNTKLCIWSAGGTLLATTAQFSAGVGRSLRTVAISLAVTSGTNYYIGFWRDPAKTAQWGVAASGTFRAKYSAAASSTSGDVACAAPYTCGAIQAYATYTSTNPTTPITTASAGWVKAVDKPNGDEEVQIWYKPNCGAAEAAPTFTTAGGASAMQAQVAEFSGMVLAGPLDSTGSFAQGTQSHSMTATNAAGDAGPGDLILTATRWVLTGAATTTFVNTINNASSVRAGDNGASSVTRHSCFNFGIVPAAAAAGTRAPAVVVAGGQGAGGGAQNSVFSAAVNPAASPNDLFAWSLQVGVGTAANVGNFGDGAVLSFNQDGTQDVTLQYGTFGVLNGIAAGTLYIPGFNDGDQITVTAQFVNLDGDPSPLGTTVVTVGQPPSLTALAPAGAVSDGQSAISFGYNPGPGGGPEQTWRAQIIGATSGVVIADSGVRSDQSDFWQPTIAPMLDASETYVLSVTATSIDTPMDSNSSDTSTAVSAFSIAGTAPLPPTAVVVTTSAALSGAILTWVNNSTAPGTAANRVYYRRSGGLRWFLYRDQVASGGLALSLLDQLAMGASYDFAVSALDPTGGLESPLSSVLLPNPDFETAGPVQTLFKSIGTGTLGTLASWTTDAGVPTITANVVTLPVGARILSGHTDWWDCSYTQRFIFNGDASQNNFRISVHWVDGNNWIGCEVYQGNTLYLQEKLAGAPLNIGSTSGFTALVNATAYWMRLSAVGTTYTATLFTDSAGAIGTQMGTFSATIADAPVQRGKIAMEQNGASACTAGGAFANVCTVTGPAPQGWSCDSSNWTLFEPAFCWSQVAPYSGLYSVSIRGAAAPTGGATAWWSSPALTAMGAPTIAGRLKATGTAGAFIQIDSSGVSPNVTADGTWRQITVDLTPVGAGVAFRCMYSSGVGTSYYDDVSLNLTTSDNALIPTPAGGYTAMLHVAGSLTSLAPLMLRGGPTTKELLETSQAQVAGSAAPIVRMGLGDWRELDLTVSEHLAADFPALQVVLAAMRAGQQVYFRTAAGHMIQVALKPNQEIAFLPANYLGLRTIQLGLVQVPNSYSPNLPFGSARGVLSQVGGATPALDPAELAV